MLAALKFLGYTGKGKSSTDTNEIVSAYEYNGERTSSEGRIILSNFIIKDISIAENYFKGCKFHK